VKAKGKSLASKKDYKTHGAEGFEGVNPGQNAIWGSKIKRGGAGRAVLGGRPRPRVEGHKEVKKTKKKLTPVTTRAHKENGAKKDNGLSGRQPIEHLRQTTKRSLYKCQGKDNVEKY